MLMKWLPSENRRSLSVEVLWIREVTGIFVLTHGETESLAWCFSHKRQETWLLSTLNALLLKEHISWGEGLETALWNSVFTTEELLNSTSLQVVIVIVILCFHESILSTCLQAFQQAGVHGGGGGSAGLKCIFLGQAEAWHSGLEAISGVSIPFGSDCQVPAPLF